MAGGNINSLLSVIGTFNDIYVPTIDNGKPIEIETIEETSPQMQDDFMEYLMKSMTYGVNVPYGLNADSEAVQFAKSLVMENAKHLRGVVVDQKCFGRQFTKFVRLLFANEFQIGGPEKGGKTGGEKLGYDRSSVALDRIRVSFPSPAALNLTNTGDLTDAASRILQFVSELAVPADDTELNRKLRFELARGLVPGVDWDRIGKILDAAQVEGAKKALEDAEGTGGAADGAEDDIDGGGGF